MLALHGNFSLTFEDDVHCPVSFFWQPGSHGERRNKYTAHVLVYVHRGTAQLCADIVAGLAEHCPNAWIAVISNPVNSTVPIVAEVLKKSGASLLTAVADWAPQAQQRRPWCFRACSFSETCKPHGCLLRRLMCAVPGTVLLNSGSAGIRKDVLGITHLVRADSSMQSLVSVGTDLSEPE